MTVLMTLYPAPKALLVLATCFLALMNTPALAQIQTGRAANGTLWISDQPLPSGVKGSVADPDQVLTLPPEPKTGQSSALPSKTPDAKPTARKLTAEEQATCQRISQRYNDSKSTLEQTEKAKASGQLLIPESGLVTMRQNLATLERMRSLCQ